MNNDFFELNGEAIGVGDVTLHGLEKWTCHLFENFGWMTLAYAHADMDKVSSYLICINKLKLSIQERLKNISSQDAEYDLKKLLIKVEHLCKITDNHFNKKNIQNAICNKCKGDIKLEKLTGGAKSSKSSGLKVLKVSKNTNLDSLKKLSKKSSKKLSKKTSKNQSKSQTKKQLKDKTKKPSKKSSKKNTSIFKKI